MQTTIKKILSNDLMKTEVHYSDCDLTIVLIGLAI